MAYIDWSQQEFGIAAALSGDQNMMDAYRSGDPYLSFAKQAGAVPPHATKQSHAVERELFKQCILATQYGMAEESLAARINKPIAYARELLRQHRRTYEVFCSWSDRVVNHALLGGQLWTVFGWRLNISKAGAVGIALWFLVGVKKSQSFRATRQIEEIAGCGRKAVYAALDALENAGLIKFSPAPGARPIVEILKLDSH